jgi:hypothetical protein
MNYNQKVKTITCTDDIIKYHVNAGEEIIYNGKHYIFNGFQERGDIFTEIKGAQKQDQYIGNQFLYHDHVIEILQKNKNGTYSAQEIYKNGKRGGKFSLLPQDMKALKSIEN